MAIGQSTTGTFKPSAGTFLIAFLDVDVSNPLSQTMIV